MRCNPLAIEDHPLYEVVFTDFFEFLDARSPQGTITEETKDCMMKKSSCGATYLQLFLEGLRQRGHHATAHLLPAVPATVLRERIYIVSLTDQLGGKAALEHTKCTIEAIHAHLSSVAPVDIRSIVGNRTSTQLDQLRDPTTKIRRDRERARARERERGRDRQSRDRDRDRQRQTEAARDRTWMARDRQ